MIRNSLILAVSAAVIALGALVWVTDAPAYAGTASEICANCHVMDSMYENYYHSSHREWAECSSCHLPHDNLANYYFEKGRQGMHDVYIFSTGQEPEVLRASEHSKRIIQENCIHCHQEAVEMIMKGTQPFDRFCWECHRHTAHGARGASMAPYQDAQFYPSQ